MWRRGSPIPPNPLRTRNPPSLHQPCLNSPRVGHRAGGSLTWPLARVSPLSNSPQVGSGRRASWSSCRPGPCLPRSRRCWTLRFFELHVCGLHAHQAIRFVCFYEAVAEFLRKGNLAFNAAMSLSVMGTGAWTPGSGTAVGPARMVSSCISSLASAREFARSTGSRADGAPASS